MFISTSARSKQAEVHSHDSTVCKCGRKRKQRLKEKDEQEKAEQRALERKEAQLKEALKRMSATAVAILNVIVIDKQHIFHQIDNWAASQLKENPSILKVPSRRIVRRTLTMLVDRGYLTHDSQDDPLNDRYDAKQKLLDDWIEIRRERESSTH